MPKIEDPLGKKILNYLLILIFVQQFPQLRMNLYEIENNTTQ